MLPLDSPRWADLQHAYGSAGKNASAPRFWSAEKGLGGYSQMANTVDCLIQLESKPQRLSPGEEPWDTLLSSLCHQGTVYSASFAAVPHIVEIGLRAAQRQEIDMNFFLLPTSIEHARLEGQQPKVDDDILTDYHAAIGRLPELANAVRSHTWPSDYVQVVLSAIAVAKGHLSLSKFLLEWTEELKFDEYLEWLEEG
jgi:hypothetical protein